MEALLCATSLVDTSPLQNIANISFDYDDKNKQWVFKCGASAN